MSDRDTAVIFVLAGPNGGGKSSVGGELVAASGAGSHYNPDAVARDLLRSGEALTLRDANSLAWTEMVRLLEEAVANAQLFAFETTLGGKTLTDRLLAAAIAGAEVNIWYVALGNAEAHLARIASRVADGGHDIPEEDVRRRYAASPGNLARLVPHAELIRVFDNSANALAAADAQPTLVCESRRGELTYRCALEQLPTWAEVVVAAAAKRGRY